MAKALTKRWKELSPEERGYYRDLAANEEESSSQLKKFDTTIAPTKSQKVAKVSADLSQKNKQRLVDMLENMKLAKKKDNSMRKTVVPCTIDLERVEEKFNDSRSKIPAINNKNLVVGPLNEKLWIVRTSFQLWALDHEQLYRGLDIEPNPKEVSRSKNFVTSFRGFSKKSKILVRLSNILAKRLEIEQEPKGPMLQNTKFPTKKLPTVFFVRQ